MAFKNQMQYFEKYPVFCYGDDANLTDNQLRTLLSKLIELRVRSEPSSIAYF